MHPEILSLSLFMLVTSCSPGPNNIVASYSGFNFGLAKTIPHMCGVIFGFTTLVVVMNFGLINIFKKFPILQETLKYTGSIFLIYLACKIAFSKTESNETSKNPVKFIETFFFQFLNRFLTAVRDEPKLLFHLLLLLLKQEILISHLQYFFQENYKLL